jgi:hypothetical protein
LLKRFSDTLLEDLGKFTLQTYLNGLAANFSKSVLTKIRVYISSMPAKAIELGMLVKNPARKLAVPRSGKRPTGIHLTPQQIPANPIPPE